MREPSGDMGPLVEDELPAATPSIGSELVLIDKDEGILVQAALTQAHVWMLLGYGM